MTVEATRRAAVAVAVLVLTLLPAGCGGSGGDAYCAELKADQVIFSDDGTGLELISNLPKLEKLAAAAPDDLGDEWQTFTTALETVRDAVRKAGLEPKDFVDGQPPAGTTAADRTAIAAAANELASQDVVTSATGIEQQAKDVCKLQLGL